MNSLIKSFRYALIPTIVTTLLLLIPLIAMQFTQEVVWTLGDFIVGGSLLFGTGLTYSILRSKYIQPWHRLAAGLALAAGLLLIWANLAVGIIGSENQPINQLYFGVIAVGLIGALLTRFRPTGMAYTMVAMAAVQSIISAAALIGGFYQTPPTTATEIVVFNGLFVTLFLLSALLFRTPGTQAKAIG